MTYSFVLVNLYLRAFGVPDMQVCELAKFVGHACIVFVVIVMPGGIMHFSVVLLCMVVFLGACSSLDVLIDVTSCLGVTLFQKPGWYCCSLWIVLLYGFANLWSLCYVRVYLARGVVLCVLCYVAFGLELFDWMTCLVDGSGFDTDSLCACCMRDGLIMLHVLCYFGISLRDMCVCDAVRCAAYTITIDVTRSFSGGWLLYGSSLVLIGVLLWFGLISFDEYSDVFVETLLLRFRLQVVELGDFLDLLLLSEHWPKRYCLGYAGVDF
eukprot:gene2885-1867_t